MAETSEQCANALVSGGNNVDEGTDGLKFVGDQAIAVMVMEDGKIHTIVV